MKLGRHWRAILIKRWRLFTTTIRSGGSMGHCRSFTTYQSQKHRRHEMDIHLDQVRHCYRSHHVHGVCLSLCLSLGLSVSPTKNRSTYRNAIWSMDSGELKESCIRWGSRYPQGKGQHTHRYSVWCTATQLSSFYKIFFLMRLLQAVKAITTTTTPI